MLRLSIAWTALLVLVAVPAAAQRPTDAHLGFANGMSISPGQLTPTPEMWFYEQELRRYQDPKEAVRRKAEFRANQRDSRIATRRWFGLSNVRPQVSPDPFNGDYAPRWSSNNRYYPFRWQGYGAPLVVWRVGRSVRY